MSSSVRRSKEYWPTTFPRRPARASS
jgi:hypothetical protein